MNNNKSYEVLLVEDNPGDIGLLKEAFRQDDNFQLTIKVAKDGEEAMTCVKNNRPDLIILDINIPKKNGFEVLKEIKSDQHLKSIPVIIMTSSGNPLDVQKAYELCANCYITKQRDFNEFAKIIKILKQFWFGSVTLCR